MDKFNFERMLNSRAGLYLIRSITTVFCLLPFAIIAIHVLGGCVDMSGSDFRLNTCRATAGTKTVDEQDTDVVNKSVDMQDTDR
jgi:hypothetical protein